MSGEKVKWSVENTCKLIGLYREARSLWDVGHPDYKNRYKMADALKKIGMLCDASPEEVDRKIKNINTEYQRERRQYQLSKKPGANKTFVPKWFGYSLLSFLKERNKARPSENMGGLSNTQESHGSDSDKEAKETETDRHNTASDSEQGSHIEEIQVKAEYPQDQMEVIDNIQTTDIENKNLQAKYTTPNKRLLSSNENRSEEAYVLVQEVYKKNQQGTSVQLDDFDIFGELVARKLRKLRTPYAQATVQHLINNLLYNAEIGQYDTPINTQV